MRRRFLLLVIVAGMFGGFGGPGRLSAVDASFKIVAQEGLAVGSLKRADVSAIYLEKKVTLGEGAFVVPLDLPVGDPVREAFSIVVHGRGAEAIDVFWNL